MALLTLVALWLLVNFGPLAVAALIVGSAIVLLTLAEPRFGLYLAVLTVPVQQYGSIKGLTATQAAFLLVLGAWAAGNCCAAPRGTSCGMQMSGGSSSSTSRLSPPCGLRGMSRRR